MIRLCFSAIVAWLAAAIAGLFFLAPSANADYIGESGSVIAAAPYGLGPAPTRFGPLPPASPEPPAPTPSPDASDQPAPPTTAEPGDQPPSPAPESSPAPPEAANAPAEPNGPDQEPAMTVATRNLAPFVQTDGNLKSGFTIDIIQEIAKRNNWKLTYLDSPSVAEQLKAVAENRADFAATAISITSERAKNFDFSQPVMSGGPQIMIPVGTSKPSTPGLVDFVKLLFSKTVFAWLLAAFVLALIPAHILWLLERRHPEPMVSKSYFPGIFQAFRWGVGSMAAAADDSPRQSLARLLAVLWAFVSIIFVSYYTATLSANFTVGKIDAQIKSASDLVGKQVCTIAKTTSSGVLDRFGVTYDGVTKIEDCYKGLQDGKYDAVVYDAPVLSYYASQVAPGTVDLVGAVLQPEDYGIAFRNGSDLLETTDEAILRMREDGTYAQIKQKWFGSEASPSGG